MLSWLIESPKRELILIEAPAFAAAIVIAEAAYKFRSFSLELIAFLATWIILGFAARQLFGLPGTRHE